jgi:flagellar basal-body rod modification protein FlgD
MPDIDPVGLSYFGVQSKPAKKEMDMEAFMRLLTVQLSNQNPLEPMNDRDFFAQMAQLGTVQGIDKLRDALDVSQATNLMGKTVTALRPMTENELGENSTVTGIVRRMTIRNGEHILGIEEPNGGIVEVKMAHLREVTQ